MPTNIIVHSKYITGNGVPIGTSNFGTSISSGQHYFDRDSRTMYIWKGSLKWVVDPELTEAWRNGTGGTMPTIKVGTTTTGQPGTPAQVTNSGTADNLILDFIIPQGIKGEKGEKGDPGTSTGGGSGAAIVVVPSGNDDTANIQAAVNQAKQTGKPVHLYGTLKFSNTVWIDKDHFGLYIDGFNTTWQSINSNPFTFLKRRQPTDNNDALNNMISPIRMGTTVHHVTISGSSNQIGIEPGPGYNHDISFNNYVGLKTGNHFRFSLHTRAIRNSFVNCFNGQLFDVGDWDGSTNFNSQSNSPDSSGDYYGNSAAMLAIREAFPNYKNDLMMHYMGIKSDEHARGFNILTEIQNIASSYRVPAGGVPFGFYGVSGGWQHDYIVEGLSAACAVDFDGLGATVVKDFTIDRGHIECVNGFSTANINLNILGGEITINKQFGQYPALFLKGTSSSGMMYTEVAHVPWWIGLNGTGNGQGKCFDTSQMHLHLEKNHAFNTLNSSMWVGTMPKAAGGDGKEGNTEANYHTYTVNYINPK